MLQNITDEILQNQYRFVRSPERYITSMTQDSANPASIMIVVYAKFVCLGAASTVSALGCQHGIDGYFGHKRGVF